MERVTIVLGNLTGLDKTLLKGDIIGVDYGAKLCAENQVQMILSIGDFDSIEEDDLRIIKEYSKSIIQLPEQKDVSDFEAALEHVNDYTEVIVLGGLGKRFDHTYVNLQLLKADSRIKFLDENNILSVKEEGNHLIKRTDYNYFSFFSIQECMISLIGFKYPLDHVVLKENDIFTLSNELLYEKGNLIIHSGKVLMIQSKD